ncbi:MAG: hypothetical protein M1821_007353 [Bathelium mastoideum]|nr:MAG: hypothetical protein M1821_007353 [Bathelium mastoideum]
MSFNHDHQAGATKSVVPKSEVEVLSQEIDDEDGFYQVRAGRKVHYLHIPAHIFDEDTMCRPYLLIPKLPDFPDTDWTTMHIYRGASGSLEFAISFDPLPTVQTTWHPRRIGVLSLKQTKRHRSNVHEVLYENRPAVAKIARFEWEIPRMETETWAYSIINRDRDEHANEPKIAPDFLGHVIENGRVIGFLMEKVDGTFASEEDLESCETALRRLHRMGLIHGDVNRYNFII